VGGFTKLRFELIQLNPQLQREKKMNYTIYALRVNFEWSSNIFSSLQNGEGRFGWSYVNTANLYQLKAKIETEGWDSLSKNEKNCYQSFLLEIKEGDYVIYINMPEWGKCSVARVTGAYFWRYDDSDFNHRFLVDPKSVFVFDRNAQEVHPDLKARLKLRGRFWRIDPKDKFEALLQNLKPVSNLACTSQVDLAISRIEIEQLFGRYSYVLSYDELNLSPFILYGNNGAGKTTIIKLLFHLLSPNQKREHYTFIAKTLFAKFTVFFANGKLIIISRQDSLLGSFTLQILQGETVISSEYIETDSHNRVQNKLGNHFYQKLLELQLNVFFIGDNRMIESDVFAADERVLTADSIEEETDVLLQALRKEIPDTDLSLKRTIARFEKWMQQQAFNATQSGIASVNSIYEDIIEQVLNLDETTTEKLPDSNEELVKELHFLQEQSQAFSDFGLITPPHIQKLINNLTQNTMPSITWRILKPYIDGITAQLDALQNFKDLLTTFVENLNQQFFHDKKIQLHVQTGLKINANNNNQALDPSILSSGEKQLLLLFCNTLMAREKATIFMIDEPEISLNIKWQRQLIRTLLNLTKNSQVQFLLATHSIELLTQYRQHVVKLSNSNNAVTE
jgi:energy-coupling factor transporter ATP-binding protein EcfA2